MPGMSGFLRIAALSVALSVASAAGAEEAVWRVGKSSGEVWMSTTGVQPVSLKQEDALKAGDTIRTGRNGRVLLVRGEEKILIAPNSVIGLPAEKKEGLSTTIVQQAGSILLEVEKRNVKHFEVETPYLAAVVKGTQFRVSVTAAGTSVDVVRGQVEVADFRTGQIAQVMPGQHATAFSRGNAGLSLSGAGTLSPIEQGKPRASSIERVPVPKAGLSAPRQAGNGQSIRTTRTETASPRLNSRAAAAAQQSHPSSARHGGTRISSALGEVRVNFHGVTHGLARGSAAGPVASRNAVNRETVWGSREARANSGFGGSNQGNSSEGSNGNAAAIFGASNAASSSGAATAAAIGNSSGNGNGNGNNGANANSGNGNGNNGNGNGNGNGRTNVVGSNGDGNGNNGNGNGGGNGNNGNNGNGNNGHGNNGNGNGHAKNK